VFSAVCERRKAWQPLYIPVHLQLITGGLLYKAKTAMKLIEILLP